MIIPPRFTITPQITNYLATIEAVKEIVEVIPVPLEVATNIVRQSTLKSSLFSARIEGNPLTLRDFSYASSQERKKIEVLNILKALQQILKSPKKSLTKEDLLAMHTTVMNSLTTELGRFRTEVSAIFNTAGIAVYMPPPPTQISSLIDSLLTFLNSDVQENILLRACLAHFSFEKIHPFLDGNGRVGRLILQAILHNNGYGLKGMLSIEEYLDSNRALYYNGLDKSATDVTEYLTFMLEALADSAKKVKDLVLQKKDITKEDTLLPRRLEILLIIRDHKMVTFDQIRRRFLAVNERTLRYDLKKLADEGFITKRGTTKGVCYEAKET